jgi:tripartite-type tricarboxylate transporter receptor subunit TctC
MITRRRLGLLAATMPVPLTLPALAQGWPSRPISIVVPFPPGGSNDLLARPLAAKLQQAMGGHPVVVDNRGGAGGTVGAMHVVRGRWPHSDVGPYRHAGGESLDLPEQPL